MKDFPIAPMTPVIVRDNSGVWYPVFFSDVDHEDDLLPFAIFGHDNMRYGYELLAPLAGNERFIGTKDDPADLWDADRLKEEGYV